MKYYFIVFVSLLFLNNIQGQNYWQQKADYKISVDVNVKNNKYRGYQEIRYTNNSRDTLNKIFFIYILMHLDLKVIWLKDLLVQMIVIKDLM
jgi:hypothetical protein